MKKSQLSLSIKARFIALTAIIFVLMSLMLINFYYNYVKVYNATNDELISITKSDIKDRIKLATDSVAFSLSTLIKGKNKAEQVAIIGSVLEDLRYEKDKSGYFFCHSDYTPVVLPIRKDLIGKRLYDLKDTRGKLFVREIRDNAYKKDGGFTTYTFNQVKGDGTNVVREKTTYSILIPNSDDILLATGIYIDNINQKVAGNTTSIKELMRNNFVFFMTVAVIGFVLIVTLILLFAKRILTAIKRMQEGLGSFFDFLNKRTKSVDYIEVTTNDEFGQMAKQINHNIKKVTANLSSEYSFLEQINSFVNELKTGNFVAELNTDTQEETLQVVERSLIELKGALSENVCKNGRAMLDLLESYKGLDFTRQLDDDAIMAEHVNLF